MSHLKHAARYSFVGVKTLQLLCFRLKKFDPDNDDESLSNLEPQCDGKEDMLPLHGSCLPVDSVEYMESGMCRVVDVYL